MPKRSRVDEAALVELIQCRGQVLRRREIERCGMPSRTISNRTGLGGEWQRILPGIVVTFRGVISQFYRMRAALLYGGGGAVVTGLTALRLRELRELPRDADVHLLVPHRRRRQSTSYVLVERTRRLPAHQWAKGLPCAPVARAVVDAARRMRDVDSVRAMVAEAVQRSLCTVDGLVDELAHAQRRGTGPLRGVLREVMAGVRSVAEAKARSRIRAAGLPEPVWNHDLFDADGDWIARPDAIWVASGVVLEIDSMAWHLSPSSYRRTQARQRRLTKLGLLVIPVAPTAFDEQPEEVLATVRAALRAAKARPTPEFTVRPARP